MALRLLVWRYEKAGQPLPDDGVLRDQARRLVDDAHRIAKERGGNVLSILKEMAGDIRRR
jgi:hypothetical protein